MNPRDPRARSYVDEEDDEPSGAAGKSLAIIALMFVLGAGVGFGYFKISAPHVNPNSSAPSTTTPTASPASSPTSAATKTATP
jgi:hypothetical protein